MSQPRTSEGPAEDLGDQRDSFIQTFFRRGAELTEELLRESTQMRAKMAELEAENAALRRHLASDDAIRELLSKIDLLERERHDLMIRAAKIEANEEYYGKKFVEIEAENAHLASLYVASFQLHSTLDLPTVVRRVKELLNQLVGARSFALYLLDDDRELLVPVISQGVDPHNLGAVKMGEGLIGKAASTSQSHWVESDPSFGTVENPSACIPLVLGDRSVGVVVVHSTFEQKNAFVDLDFELFKLIAAHAASAIAAARLFALHGSRIGPLDAFHELD